MKKKGLNMEQKRSLTGWAFLLPAALLIFVFCFYPMVQALILSFQKGTGSAVQPAGFANYVRILKDATFQQCLFNTIFYFVIQVPIMLILALILAQLLNSPDIKGKGIYTIVAEAAGPGATKWGKLKSGAGWISLDYVTKL